MADVTPRLTDRKMSVCPPYLEDLRDHIHHVRNHTLGIDDNLWGSDAGGLPFSVLPPATHWSEDEKNRFFRAVSRHSRLRPDMIADELHGMGKTAVDVCIYMQTLENAVVATGSELNANEARPTPPIAVESDQSVISLENRQAHLIMKAEKQRRRLPQAQPSPPKNNGLETDELSPQGAALLDEYLHRYAFAPEGEQNSKAGREDSEGEDELMQDLFDNGVDLPRFLAEGVDVFEFGALLRFRSKKKVAHVDDEALESVPLATLLDLRDALREWLKAAMARIISLGETYFETRDGTNMYTTHKPKAEVTRKDVIAALSGPESPAQKLSTRPRTRRSTAVLQILDANPLIGEQHLTGSQLTIIWHPEAVLDVERFLPFSATLEGSKAVETDMESLGSDDMEGSEELGDEDEGMGATDDEETGISDEEERALEEQDRLIDEQENARLYERYGLPSHPEPSVD